MINTSFKEVFLFSLNILFSMKNIPPKYYTMSAFIIGFLLLEETNSNEQNALGNWLMLISQVLCTNAYFVQLNNLNKANNFNGLSIETLEKMLNKLKDEIEVLKKENRD